MSIRFARKADCAAIAEIYNHAVLYTAAIWNDQTVDADNRIAWFEARTLAGYPVLVSEEDGVVTGYASFGDWRSFDGFRHTVEHSVYVHPDHQGKGLGRKLLSRLIDEARDCGKHVMGRRDRIAKSGLAASPPVAGICRHRANAAGRH